MNDMRQWMFLCESNGTILYHGTSKSLEHDAQYNGTEKLLFLADEQKHARIYGQNIYKCKVDLGKIADLTSSSKAFKQIVAEYPFAKHSIEIGETWKTKGLLRKIITSLFQHDYDSIVLFDTHTEDYQKGDDDEYFGTTYIVKNPQHCVFVL